MQPPEDVSTQLGVVIRCPVNLKQMSLHEHDGEADASPSMLPSACSRAQQSAVMRGIPTWTLAHGAGGVCLQAKVASALEVHSGSRLWSRLHLHDHVAFAGQLRLPTEVSSLGLGIEGVALSNILGDAAAGAGIRHLHSTKTGDLSQVARLQARWSGTSCAGD